MFNVGMIKNEYTKTTQKIFQPYTTMVITEELAEEIKLNLVNFFELLISWQEEKEANQM